MDESSNCSLNLSSEFFVTYNYTVRFTQPYLNCMTWASAIICISAVIINTAFVIRLPNLIKTSQLAFKRYAFILNLAVSDIVGCAVVGLFSVDRLRKGQSLFGDFVNANLDGIDVDMPAILTASYAAQIVYTFICVLQYLAASRPIYYSLHISRSKVVVLCLIAWFLTLALAPTIILPVILVDKCLTRALCMSSIVLFRGLVECEVAFLFEINDNL